jgi:hypothetical protein
MRATRDKVAISVLLLLSQGQNWFIFLDPDPDCVLHAPLPDTLEMEMLPLFGSTSVHSLQDFVMNNYDDVVACLRSLLPGGMQDRQGYYDTVNSVLWNSQETEAFTRAWCRKRVKGINYMIMADTLALGLESVRNEGSNE